jgi:hypothetical protein
LSDLAKCPEYGRLLPENSIELPYSGCGTLGSVYQAAEFVHVAEQRGLGRLISAPEKPLNANGFDEVISRHNYRSFTIYAVIK